MSKTISAYDVKAGQTFNYCGKTYTATQATRGEFRPWIRVKDDRTKSGSSEILLNHGDTVLPLTVGEWYRFSGEGAKRTLLPHGTKVKLLDLDLSVELGAGVWKMGVARTEDEGGISIKPTDLTEWVKG